MTQLAESEVAGADKGPLQEGLTAGAARLRQLAKMDLGEGGIAKENLSTKDMSSGEIYVICGRSHHFA